MINHKIKPLLPCLREKKRYLAFEIISESKITDVSKVKQAIMDSCLRFLGEFGMAKAGLLILPDKYNPLLQRGLIRVSHKMANELRASLAFVQAIDGQKVIVRSVGLSGILKKAEKKYLQGDNASIEKTSR
jgi:ribonuclease P/MRP protein subunit POP5